MWSERGEIKAGLVKLRHPSHSPKAASPFDHRQLRPDCWLSVPAPIQTPTLKPSSGDDFYRFILLIYSGSRLFFSVLLCCIEDIVLRFLLHRKACPTAATEKSPTTLNSSTLPPPQPRTKIAITTRATSENTLRAPLPRLHSKTRSRRKVDTLSISFARRVAARDSTASCNSVTRRLVA